MRELARYRLPEGAAAAALTAPPTVVAVFTMVLNDRLLKGSGVVPGLVTGKLSDLAFLFFAPLVLVYVMRARTLLSVVAAFALPTALFVAINVSNGASAVFEGALSTIMASSHVCDVEDLLALAILPVAWWYLWRCAPRRTVDRSSVRAGGAARWQRMVVIAVASLGCVATSAQQPPPLPPQPTHQAVYMSWDELRSTAVQVRAPQPIGTRGKLLIAGDHLFLSEPGKGVHVFDNTDPKAPRAVMFIQIPGNVDIAVREGHLYADSFVDLLVFELDLPNRSAKLLHRLEDQYAYDPYQTLATDTAVHVEGIDKTKGVVVRLEPVQSNAKVAQ